MVQGKIANAKRGTCVENLTDANYRNAGSGQNEPGFNAILGARVTW